MSKYLVVVESPPKAKSIGRILGDAYAVKSSVGHVRDLPTRRLGVNIERNFEPSYEVTKGKTKVIDELRRAARHCEMIFLAPDPDREGEAIAWHLKELLSVKGDGIPFVRVQYNEITPRAVRAAFEHPGEIDMNRVNAQQARRVLDRLVGYKVSPLLWRQVKRGLSAGRVQSVALRLVCEREKAILDFKPESYWIMGAQVRKQVVPLDPFRIRLSRIDGKRAEIRDESFAETIRADIQGRPLRVAKLKSRSVSRRPPPPFITSTLQQAASTAFGISPGRTMRLAQTLYEGVDFGKGTVGLITYMRTDSVNVSREALESVRAHIGTAFGGEFLPDKPNRYRSRGSAQEAHEAIRPTDPGLTPEQLPKQLGAQERKLYALIWKRFVASQMTPAKIDYRIVEIDSVPEPAQQHRYGFAATAGELVFPGFLKVMGTEQQRADRPVNPDEDPVEPLPPLGEGEPLECIEWLCERKETTPPPRFSEAALVRSLEANGVGRPSTYAGIIETLTTRKYAARAKRMLSPTPLGMQVNALLCEKLDPLFDIGFTARMEADLDRIEAGELQWTDMLRQFYKLFQKWLDAARTPPADPAALRTVLDLLGGVRHWAPGRTQGKRTFSDEKFYESIAEQARAGEKPVSQAQLEALLRLLCRYKAQIEGVEETLRHMGREELLESAELKPPREISRRKLQWLQSCTLADSEERFIASLRAQVEAGRRLSPAQVRVLDSVIVAQAGKKDPASLEKICAEFEIEPPDEGEYEHNRQLLEALGHVRSWREPTRRRQRTYDDASFVNSLRDQFERRRTLSPKQQAALRLLAVRYREQIPDFDRLAEQLKLSEKTTAADKAGSE